MITLTWYKSFKLNIIIINKNINNLNFIKDMNKKQIITKSEQISYKSVKILFKTIKKVSMIVAMTVRKAHNLIVSWCDEVEQILFIEKV